MCCTSSEQALSIWRPTCQDLEPGDECRGNMSVMTILLMDNDNAADNFLSGTGYPNKLSMYGLSFPFRFSFSVMEPVVAIANNAIVQ